MSHFLGHVSFRPEKMDAFQRGSKLVVTCRTAEQSVAVACSLEQPNSVQIPNTNTAEHEHGRTEPNKAEQTVAFI